MNENNAYPIQEAQEPMQEIKKPQRSKLVILSHILSALFTPLLAPTYGTIVALNFTYVKILSPLYTRTIVTLAILAFTCMIPVVAIAILYKLGKISDPGVNEQKDRFIPYTITILSYLAGAIYLTNVNAPEWMPMFLVGGGIAAITSALINFKWKISAHGAGMGGLIALMFSIWANGYATFDYMAITSVVILLAGAVGTSRLILKRHTLAQIAAGTLNGFFWVFLLTI